MKLSNMNGIKRDFFSAIQKNFPVLDALIAILSFLPLAFLILEEFNPGLKSYGAMIGLRGLGAFLGDYVEATSFFVV